MDTEDYEHLLPITIEVEKGKSYTWCGCGESKTQPFCDKNNCPHKAITIRAVLNETVYFCACKQTKNPPWCDGSHAKVLLEKLKHKHIPNS